MTRSINSAWTVLAALALGCGQPAKPAPAAALPPGGAHHHPATMVHRFDDANAWAKVFDDPARDAWQEPDRVVAALGLAPNMTVADVGAGTGYFTVRLARAVPAGQVIATDIEPDMVRHLGERAAREQLGNVRAVLATADEPGLAPETVDRVLVVDVWHHIADRVRYAKGLARALRPGGQIAIVDFTLAATHGPPPRHRLAPEAIIADLRAAGLDAALAPTQLPEQYIVTGTRR
jgi:SAM-dependent methyltransferase